VSRPFVSLVTPTRDRPAFLALLRACIERQDHPRDRLEWVVVDDGRAPAEASCAGFPNLVYRRVEPLPLGAKRNLCHALAGGEFLVCLDDDDYYPPERVSHAVDALLAAPDRLVAGASELPLYFAGPDEVWHLGPYAGGHATAATWAFRRELLREARCDAAAARGEEAAFLSGFTRPMVQLDPARTLLALAHGANTYDKAPILREPAAYRARRTERRLADVIPDAELRARYLALLRA
jgi:glycosyltransferase involved in cell wall biosynthesis